MRITRVLALVLMILSIAPTQGPAAEPAGHPQADAGGPRFALLVGVTRYQNFPSLALQGPANDVILVRQVLKDRFGFQDTDIVTLSEADGAQDPSRLPNRANIEREMVTLATKVARTKDARVVVYLSGHGTRQPDLLRPPADVKPDGRSEVFLPADFNGWDKAARRLKNTIIDFELRDWLKDIRGKGARVWAIVDCCYSGTIARALAVPRKVDERDPGLAIPREAFVEAERRGAANPAGGRNSPGRAPIDEPGLVAVYASLPTETTFEDLLPYYPRDEKQEQKKHGVLTWHLAQVLYDVTASNQLDITYTELVKRIRAKYYRLGIDHPTPLVEGLDRDQQVLWNKPVGGPRRGPMYLSVAPNGALKVDAGRLHGLVENSVLALYPTTRAVGTGAVLGHLVVTKVRTVDSDVAPWDEAKAADFQKGRYAPPKHTLQGGELCAPVFLAYGDLKLRVAAATTGEKGEPIDPKSVKIVRGVLGELTERARQYVTVVEPGNAQWLVRAAGGGLQLLRREGMTTGPLAILGSDPVRLSDRLTAIARAQMLLQMETGDSPPDEASVRAGEAIAFGIELLRQAGGTGEFQSLPLGSGAGPVFRVGDRVQLRFTNRGILDTDITVLQVDQNYDIIPMFPFGSGGVQNRLYAPERVERNDKALYTGRPRVQEDGVTPRKDEDGVRRGVHYFVVIAVKGEGDPVDFRSLATPTGGEKDIPRGPARDPRSILKALQGEGDTRAGLGRDSLHEFAVRVIRWEIRKPAKVK
jgi:hypothetical protein